MSGQKLDLSIHRMFCPARTCAVCGTTYPYNLDGEPCDRCLDDEIDEQPPDDFDDFDDEGFYEDGYPREEPL